MKFFELDDGTYCVCRDSEDGLYIDVYKSRHDCTRLDSFRRVSRDICHDYTEDELKVFVKGMLRQ